jgi:predicted nucleotide-binding protein
MPRTKPDSELRLTIPLEVFKETLLRKCADFIPTERLLEQKTIEEIRTMYNQWYLDIEEYYEASFNAKYNDFCSGIAGAVSSLLDEFRGKGSISFEDIKERYKKIHERVIWDVKCITACEILYADENRIEHLKSKIYSVAEKLNFILGKLYDLRDDRTFSIYKLMIWNGIEVIRKEEPKELALELKRKQLVTINESIYLRQGSSDPAYVKITSKGEQIVENLKKHREKEHKKEQIPLGLTDRRNNKNIFIVHGHDKVTKLELRNLIKEEFKLNPVILGEKPISSLNTIFNKIDEHARDCAAAIVLMTPDDKVGGESRARENVLLELGYFIGLFPPGDRRVLILRKGDSNIPSDIQGVERIDFRESIEEIHLKLKKQFEHWGLIK